MKGSHNCRHENEGVSAIALHKNEEASEEEGIAMNERRNDLGA